MACRLDILDLFVKDDNFSTKGHSSGFTYTQACWVGLSAHSRGKANPKASIQFATVTR